MGELELRWLGVALDQADQALANHPEWEGKKRKRKQNKATIPNEDHIKLTSLTIFQMLQKSHSNYPKTKNILNLGF